MAIKTPKDVNTELTIHARVTLTQEILDAIARQYPEFWETNKDNPEEVAEFLLRARFSNVSEPLDPNTVVYWLDVGDITNLVNDIELI